MRIWWQSSTALGRDPLWNEYEQSLKNYVQEVARPDTVVDVHGVEVMTPSTERCHYFEDLNTLQVVDNAVQAEREGYDAFVFGHGLDSGSLGIRQIVDIPVLFSAETPFLLACLLSPNFSLIGFNTAALLRAEEWVKYYGLQERYVPGGCFEIDLVQLQQGFTNPDPVIKGATKAAREIIKRGACMLIPSCMCLNMIFADNSVKDIDGVPILDMAAALVKTAELMVDLKALGISRSKSGLYTPVSKEELTQVRKLYGVE
ncbi:aspartate/glutamate racemase family protein [Chloroflexota bacterium]